MKKFLKWAGILSVPAFVLLSPLGPVTFLIPAFWLVVLSLWLLQLMVKGGAMRAKGRAAREVFWSQKYDQMKEGGQLPYQKREATREIEKHEEEMPSPPQTGNPRDWEDRKFWM